MSENLIEWLWPHAKKSGLADLDSSPANGLTCIHGSHTVREFPNLQSYDRTFSMAAFKVEKSHGLVKCAENPAAMLRSMSDRIP
jgi:hypothetical protein